MYRRGTNLRVLYVCFLCKECKLEEMRRMKPKMTSARRRTLMLSMEEATSVTQLQKEVKLSQKHSHIHPI